MVLQRTGLGFGPWCSILMFSEKPLSHLKRNTDSLHLFTTSLHLGLQVAATTHARTAKMYLRRGSSLGIKFTAGCALIHLDSMDLKRSLDILCRKLYIQTCWHYVHLCLARSIATCDRKASETAETAADQAGRARFCQSFQILPSPFRCHTRPEYHKLFLFFEFLWYSLSPLRTPRIAWTCWTFDVGGHLRPWDHQFREKADLDRHYWNFSFWWYLEFGE